MRKFLAAVVLTAMLLVGSGLLVAATGPTVCPAQCCTGPQDCPTPACCPAK